MSKFSDPLFFSCFLTQYRDTLWQFKIFPKTPASKMSNTSLLIPKLEMNQRIQNMAGEFINENDSAVNFIKI